jgi:asparagine synthase (glutamine-hydrolysing)
MYRYLALIWNPRDAQASTYANTLSERMMSLPSGWARAFTGQGVIAFHAGLNEGASGTVLLDNDAGAVFGRIFNRDTDDTARALRVGFDRPETSRIVQTGGRRLFERFWGRYVALVQDAGTGETWILRDPTGGMPCLMMVHQGVNLVFSDFEDCYALGIRQFNVNWEYIRRMLAFGGYQSRKSALNEVSEIQFGERIRFSGNTLHRSLEWNAFEVAQTNPIDDPERAVVELRRATRGCVHAWASCHTDIIHNLSGGLDSSIVLSCLKDAPSRPNITCLNYFGTGPDEDERKYARSMAKHADAELVEYQLDIQDMKLERLLSLRRSSRPWFYAYELEHGPFEERLAAAKEANALFSGAGGDGVFFQARAELAVSDYLFDHGLGGDLLRVAVDAARVSKKSVWPLLSGALRARFFPASWHPMRQMKSPFERTLVNQDLLRAAEREPEMVHPWFADQKTRGIPPGVLWHVMSVAGAPMYYSSFDDSQSSVERTLPLMSQPLIEVCLRTPTYVLIKNGMDRATARRAFAPDLPPEIIKRRAKGRIDHHLRNVLDANLDFVRDLLLDGRLVKEGLLNRANLEVYLTRSRSPADFQYSEILQSYLCMEAWLKRWSDGRERAAEPQDAGRAVTSSCAPGC